jgi:hypothetical protein
MSHPHLEHYFALLSAAWPADDPLRDDALDELRDHALAVYEEELAAGRDFDAAASAAIEACGEANHLVRNLRGESHRQRGRWMMRLTTAALIAGLIASGTIAVWWPGGKPADAPLASVAQAQGPGAAPSGANPAPAKNTVEAEIEANNSATQKKLGEVIAAEYFETPAQEVFDSLAGQLEVEIYLNQKALAEAGVALDGPVTLKLKRVRGDMLLDLVLQQVAAGVVDYIIRDGIVVVTTVDSLDGASEVKAYPVADLLKLHHATRKGEAGGAANDPTGSPAGAPAGSAPPGAGSPPGGGGGGGFGGGFGGGVGGGGGGGFGGGGFGGIIGGSTGGDIPPSAEQLIHVIHNTVAPSTWELNGGSGTITFYGDMLVIRQTARTHREVEKVLKLLRDTAAKK